MEARNCAARDADEHDGEKRQSFGVCISQPVGQFREFRMIDVEHCQNAYRHKQQGYRENGVYLPDNFIYRQQRSQDIIKENDLVVINGETGEIYVNSPKGEYEKLEKMQQEQKKQKEELEKYKNKKSITKDGHEVEILANIGGVQDVENVLKNTAEGIRII